MRTLILQRITVMLAGATAQQMRWQNFADYVYTDILNKDSNTKAGKKEFKTLALDKVDFSVLTDENLLAVFESVCRKYYAQF